jgi:uncharacterized membrane protein YhhN
VIPSLLAVAAVSLAALLWFGERHGVARVQWPLKTLTSACFLAVASLMGPRSTYDGWIFAGLVLSFMGDLALIPRERRWFLAGLVAFLMAHVAYTVAFADVAPAASPAWTALAVIALASLGAYLHFRPRLGAMHGPVVVYIVVISIMLAAAWTVALGRQDPFGWQVAAGATLFYLSDIAVARRRFTPGAGFGTRAVGLPVYYAAQFLFALSIGGA